MLRSATHCTSGAEEIRVTRGGAILRTSCLMSSSLLRTLAMVDEHDLDGSKDDAALACWNEA